MKKTLLALAVLGTFAGVASAQSSVTLYGRLDTAVSWDENGAGDSTTGMNRNLPIGGSRFGFRGSEDLGGGLKANFVLEAGFNSDDGTNSSRLFSRLSYVGLSDSWGEVRLGRVQSMTRELTTFAADITAEGEMSIVDTTGTSLTAAGSRPYYQNFATRRDNSLTYITPNFSGFQGRILAAAGENTTADTYGVFLGYGAGPLKAGVTYETYADGPATSGTYNEVITVGAQFDFGFMTLAGGYQDTSDFGTDTAFTPGIDHNAFNVGVMVPFGALQVRAQYTESTVELPGGDVDQEKYGLSLRYLLSKRTTVYSVFEQRSGDNDNVAGFVREELFEIGVGHNF